MKRVLYSILVLMVPALVWASVEVDSGSSYWVRRQNVTASACITETAASAVCALFPAGTSRFHKKRLVTVSTDAAVGCSWSGEDGATLSGVELTDTGGEYGDGPAGGPGVWLEGGQAWEDQPSREVHRTQGVVGARTGLCENKHTSGGDQLHAPCDADDDCTNYGGGSCILAPTASMVQSAGEVLICVATNANVLVSRIRLPDDA